MVRELSLGGRGSTRGGKILGPGSANALMTRGSGVALALLPHDRPRKAKPTMTRVTTVAKSWLPAPAKAVLKRGIQRLRNRGFTPYVKRKTVEGVTFDLWVGDADGRDWYDRHCTDPDWPEMRFIRDRLIEPGDVVFECGAHHGCTTVLLSRWVEDHGSVVAFEPLPANCAIIAKTLELNAIKNVTLEAKAVGARPGTVRIDGISNSSVLMSGRGIETPQVRLDDYASLNPTVLKLDVEGYETEVLKGARSILRRRPKLAVEVHAEQLTRFGSSVEELLGLIDLGGYRCWVQWNDADAPREYDMRTRITTRVHLFCVPKRAS